MTSDSFGISTAKPHGQKGDDIAHCQIVNRFIQPQEDKRCSLVIYYLTI